MIVFLFRQIFILDCAGSSEGRREVLVEEKVKRVVFRQKVLLTNSCLQFFWMQHQVLKINQELSINSKVVFL